MNLYFDGGARPNPGLMSHAFVTDDGYEYFEVTQHGSNNEAEWFACMAACWYAADQGCVTATIRGDSLLVINQIKGLWKIKMPAFRQYRAYVLECAEGRDFTFEHVLRDANPAGKFIERMYKAGY
jgi:ribonuclease HI